MPHKVNYTEGGKNLEQIFEGSQEKKKGGGKRDASDSGKQDKMRNPLSPLQQKQQKEAETEPTISKEIAPRVAFWVDGSVGLKFAVFV